MFLVMLVLFDARDATGEDYHPRHFATEADYGELEGSLADGVAGAG